MKFKSIELENFGPYFGSNKLNLSTSETAPVILIHGENERGKTSLLHAFRWGLYGKTKNNIGNLINEINFFDLITFILLPLIILLPFFLLAFNRKFRILEVFKNLKISDSKEHSEKLKKVMEKNDFEIINRSDDVQKILS